MPSSIDTVSARSKLKPKREPYWRRLRKGCHLGYRKMTAKSSGQWIVRFRTDEGKQVHHTLGSLDEYSPQDRFDKASNLAMDWFKHLRHGGSTEVWTVEDACAAYVTQIKEDKGEKAATDLQARYKRWVMNDPISKVPLMKLKREQVRKFRRCLRNAPVTMNKRGDTRERSSASVNRDMTALRAALNYAHLEGKITSDIAWALELKPTGDAGPSASTAINADN